MATDKEYLNFILDQLSEIDGRANGHTPKANNTFQTKVFFKFILPPQFCTRISRYIQGILSIWL